MKRYAITTLGCKVNQCESSAMGGILESSGYRAGLADDHNDLIIINTCTVTGKAAMQSRQAIRQAMRRHPKAKIVVTGCYAQTAPDEIKAIGGVEYIVGHADKLAVARVIEDIQPAPQSPAIVHQNIHHVSCFDPMPSVVPESRTRAFLKIQDGCNAFCTYCIVPHARGRSRSMPLEDVLKHFHSLYKAHFKEVVLTGIHLGAYGKDLTPNVSLNELLVRMTQHNKGLRLRLSSIEPTEIETDLIQSAADSAIPVCPHFHIPLQSGDNTILKRMGRPYSREQFIETIDNIRSILPRAAIGIDVLVGFPGENNEAFDHTYSLVETLDITYLHVFPFSPRNGTPAADFPNKVPSVIVKDRCRRLRQLGEKKKTTFYHSNKGCKVSVLIESIDAETGDARGMSENYIPVIVPNADVRENDLVAVRIQSVKEDLSVIGDLTI
jgi:threonylcarbamoyladenosine tRNA methylthiotransferase MtaB